VQTLFVLVISYLVGSFPSGVIAGRLHGIDLREHGSGNTGFSNALRVLGPKAGIPVLMADVGKGFLAVVAVAALAGPESPLGPTGIRIAAGLAAAAGHVWPAFTGFRGGKAVATGLGVFLALSPVSTLIALAIWGLVVYLTGYISVGSIAAAFVLPFGVGIEARLTGTPQPLALVIAAAALAIVIVVRHRSNLRRLLAGTENKVSWGRNTKEEPR
jgi:glycerol-3-phosphate acyltransferase PlsY